VDFDLDVETDLAETAYGIFARLEEFGLGLPAIGT
jgi:hypothetical protein